MQKKTNHALLLFVCALLLIQLKSSYAQHALITGSEPGWMVLGEADFQDVNGNEDTWVWKDSILYCSGEPVGVLQSKKRYKNFELMLQWRHLKSGGNSGVFGWVQPEALENLPPGKLPKQGIEFQILDHGFRDQYEQRTGKKGDWFTTNGDVFAVGESKLEPFPPTSPNGSRSFPRGEYSLGAGNWNHYYIRAINGEVRLWVNGHEVSGGKNAQPAEGFFCLEAEGSPIEFKNIRIRELP